MGAALNSDLKMKKHIYYQKLDTIRRLNAAKKHFL